MKFILLLVFLHPIYVSAKDWRFKGEPLCNQIYAVASSALANKYKGVKKEDMLAVLPTRSALEGKKKTEKVLLGLYMHEILDEVFGLHELETMSYSAYRAEICYRLDKGLNIPANFDEGYKTLASCRTLPESKRIRCGMAAAGTTEEYES